MELFFTLVPGIPLALLPHLSSTATQGDPEKVDAVAIPPEKRLQAAYSLSHPWFETSVFSREGCSADVGSGGEDVRLVGTPPNYHGRCKRFLYSLPSITRAVLS